VLPLSFTLNPPTSNLQCRCTMRDHQVKKEDGEEGDEDEDEAEIDDDGDEYEDDDYLQVNMVSGLRVCSSLQQFGTWGVSSASAKDDTSVPSAKMTPM